MARLQDARAQVSRIVDCRRRCQPPSSILEADAFVRVVAPVTDEQVAVLNHVTITGAHNYVYSHEAREEIANRLG